MKTTWTTALLVLVVLISGCTYGTEKTPQQTQVQPAPITPAATQPAQTQPAPTTIIQATGTPAPTNTSQPTTAAVAVEIKGFAFNPATITIPKGTTVTWTQKDSVQHTVTGDNFSSDILSQGQTYSYTFNETGTFEYNCHIHPSMHGKVIVT